MSSNQPIRQLDYVCNPSSIIISAAYPLGAKYLSIEMKYNDKTAFVGQYKFRLTHNRKDFDDYVILFCNAMLMFTEDEIHDYIEEDRIMHALYAYRHLKEVKTRSGTLLWSRP